MLQRRLHHFNYFFLWWIKKEYDVRTTDTHLKKPFFVGGKCEDEPLCSLKPSFFNLELSRKILMKKTNQLLTSELKSHKPREQMSKVQVYQSWIGHTLDNSAKICRVALDWNDRDSHRCWRSAWQHEQKETKPRGQARKDLKFLPQDRNKWRKLKLEGSIVQFSNFLHFF